MSRNDTNSVPFTYLTVTADGTLAATAAAAHEPVLEVLQAAVGGFIQHIPLTPDLDAILNEEGRLLQLPSNPIATALAALISGQPATDMWCGCVVLCSHDADDLTGLNPQQISAVTELHRQLRPRF